MTSESAYDRVLNALRAGGKTADNDEDAKTARRNLATEHSERGREFRRLSGLPE